MKFSGKQTRSQAYVVIFPTYVHALLHVKKDAHTITNPGNETTQEYKLRIYLYVLIEKRNYFMVCFN